MIRTFLAATVVSALCPVALAQSASELERGRYLVVIGGCNDCHTAGYGEAGGKVPEARWLTGSPLGFRGAWGTTYATNLRRYMAMLSADEWAQNARTMTTRPPMPWFNLNAMTDADLKAMHAFIRSLGVAGEAMPGALPPGQEPSGPVVRFP